MESTKKLARSTLAIVFFSFIGKILGFFRESLQASKFGAGIEMDAFTASQAATAIISALIVTSISTTFIPGLQKVENELGEDHKLKYTNNMLSIVSIFSVVLIALGIIFAQYVSYLTALKADPETFELVVKLTKIGMPVILFSAIAGVFTGFLQYEGKFAAAGAIAIPLNIVYIFYLSFLHHIGIVGLTIASVIGVLAQILFLLPDAFKVGYRPKLVLDFKDEYVKEALLLAVPVLIATSVNDLNVIVNRNLALGMETGAASILNYANKMNTMILGIFITAITAIIFPTMSRAFGTGNVKQGKRVMNASIKTVLFLTVPATIGMLILARPIVDIAYLHGRFTVQNAIDTTATLRCYTLALISISVSNVLNRVYYSISDTKTPFVVGAINVAINIALNLLVAHKYGTRGLAASVSIATTVAVLISFILLKRQIGNLGLKSIIRALVKTLMASAVMGVFCLLYFPIEGYLINFVSGNAATTLLKLIILMIIVGIAVIIYGILLYKLGVREIIDITNIAKKKLNNRKSLKQG